jgi:multidrug efflux system membrane fusion protein
MDDNSAGQILSAPRARLALALCVLGLLAAAGCSKKQDPQAASAGPPAIPVRVATVEQKTVPIQVRVIGNVEAYSTVSIKAQISGELLTVHFREGDDVRKGQLLFSIDPRPFQAALQQAEANLARDKAGAENARVQAVRYSRLFEGGVVAREQYDQMRTNADALEAAVHADQAAVERAKLDLQYCSIYSPIDGRTGSLMVHPGNLTKANDVPILVVINQLNPIYVDFALPQQYLADVKKYMAARTLKVEVYVPEVQSAASQATAQGIGEVTGPQTLLPERGTVSFIDNTVDSATGTIRLKATFPNQQRRLWPALYVNVVLTLTEQPNAVLVPTQALQTGQNGQYVFVVKADNTVESCPVVPGRAAGGDTIIEKGLQPGETVVTDGQIRLIPGSRVTIQK